ncbi:MAG: hypothetical protein C0501_04320 [Isosphaera sp.]|nr:hypothetical protein [Isosphaera sp.]
MVIQTVAQVALCVAGVVAVPVLAVALIEWFFYDTSTGRRPDYDRIAASRRYKAENWSIEADDEHEALWQRELDKCRRPTRWRRLVAWWRGRGAG